jgi:hypothetical protein
VAANVRAMIVLFGGGALALEYGARAQTQDLDIAIRTGGGNLRLYSTEISNLYGLADDWLNDDGSRFVTPEILDVSKTFWELPNLRILTPPAEALLAMKVLAMRIDRGHPDKADIIFLMRHLKLYDPDTILALVNKYLPTFVNNVTMDHRDYLDLFAAEAQS